MKAKDYESHVCPCGSGIPYQDCCQPFLSQNQDAPTAEALMRSRYTAFALQDGNYLRYSWHPDNCPADIRLNADTTWLGLKIVDTVAGGRDDVTGQVEFIARSKNSGKASRLHEISRFCRNNGRWVYIDGKFDK